jgi:hypothetical protein
MDAFVPQWHKFTNSSALETGLLPSQQFTNSHFHSTIPVELVTKCCFSGPNTFPPSLLCSHASFMYWADQCNNHHECPTISKLSAPFSDILPSYYAITMHL